MENVLNLDEFNALKCKHFEIGVKLIHVTKCYEWKIPYFYKSWNTRSIKFKSLTSLVIEESLSYWLAGLRYSLFA